MVTGNLYVRVVGSQMYACSVRELGTHEVVADWAPAYIVAQIAYSAFRKLHYVRHWGPPFPNEKASSRRADQFVARAVVDQPSTNELLD